MGAIPSHGPNPKPSSRPNATEPALKNAEASAGTPNWLHAFSTPIACAASATSSRNGNMICVSRTAAAVFSGSAWVQLGVSSGTNHGAAAIPNRHRPPTNRMIAVATRFARWMASLRSCFWR